MTSIYPDNLNSYYKMNYLFCKLCIAASIWWKCETTLQFSGINMTFPPPGSEVWSVLLGCWAGFWWWWEMWPELIQGEMFCKEMDLYSVEKWAITLKQTWTGTAYSRDTVIIPSFLLVSCFNLFSAQNFFIFLLNFSAKYWPLSQSWTLTGRGGDSPDTLGTGTNV